MTLDKKTNTITLSFMAALIALVEDIAEELDKFSSTGVHQS